MKYEKNMYEGVSLKEYCRKHNLKESTIRSRISALRKNEKYSNYSKEDIIKIALSKETSKNCSYNGISLSEYCKEHNLKESTIRARIERIYNSNNYGKLSQEEIVEIAIEGKMKTKYNYKGMKLKKYCEIHNLRYDTILKRIKNIQENEKYKNKPIEEIIDEAITKISSKYHYDGMSLKDYCELNKLKYFNILYRIKYFQTLDQYKNCSDDEIVDMAINKRKNKSYSYQGMSLKKYCEKNNLNYSTILTRIFILNNDEKYKDYTIDEVVEMAVSRKDGNTKYYYKGERLIDYCKKHNLNYNTITSYISKMNDDKKYENYSLDEKIDIAIKNYMSYKLKKETEDILNKKEINEENLKLICSYYNLNYVNILILAKEIGLVNATYLSIYFSDEIDLEGKKFVSKNKIEEIKKLKEQLNNNEVKILKEYSLNELSGLYKCGIYDTRNEIYERNKVYIRKIIFSVSKKYGIIMTKEKTDDYMNQMYLTLIDVIERKNVNNEDEFKNYINKCINGSFNKYLIDNKHKYNELILNSTIYDDNNKEYIDEIENPNNEIENLFEEDFSEDVLIALKRLDKKEYKFIMLRFKYRNDYDELANFYGVDKEKIIKKEKQILNKLKRDLIKK